MSASQILGIVSGACLILGYFPYVYSVFKKKTVPNRASWLIWAFSTTVILFGVKETGTHEAIWVPVADAVGCTFIFLLSIFKGSGGWSKTDRISMAICLASLLVWWISGSAVTALIANLLIYVSGYIPTIQKAYVRPGSESLFAWGIFFAGVFLNLITVIIGNDSGWAVWVYPVTLVITVGTLCALLLRSLKTFRRRN